MSASHCFEGDTVRAVCDGLLPKNSNDHGIPRMTWWPRRGTAEWLEYRFDEPKKVSQVDVYWFDDTGGGRCRVPQSWTLKWHDGTGWKPVATADEYGTVVDKFHTVRFDPLETHGLRLEVQLQPEFSGGVLEFRFR